MLRQEMMARMGALGLNPGRYILDSCIGRIGTTVKDGSV